MGDRYDSYLVIETVNKNGEVVSEHKRKIRCPDLLGFVKEVSILYDKHHPEDLGRSWLVTKSLDDSGQSPQLEKFVMEIS